MEKRYRNAAVLSVILLLTAILNIYYVNQKSGYYVDEGMTLFLANGHYNGTVTSHSDYTLEDFITGYIVKDGESPIDACKHIYTMLRELVYAGNYSKEGTVEWYDTARKMLQGKSSWTSGTELRNELIAEEGDTFNYTQVYINQMLDVHPIVYYILVHTVFSIFSNSYSDFFLFGINLFFLLLSCVVLYKMICRFWNNTVAALLAVALWGGSQGFASCAMYFRMYAVLTFFVVYTLYIHLMILYQETLFKQKCRNWFKLGCTVFLGFNTHYYYILFFLPLALETCIKKKKTKNYLRKYIKCMLTTGCVSIIFWPFSIYHILFGYRGTEAISNLTSGGIVAKIWEMLQILATGFCGGNIYILVMLLIIFAIYWVLNRKDICYQGLAIPVIVYIGVVLQIAPVVSDRYLMCLYPLFSGMFAITVCNLVRKYARQEKVKRMIVSGIGCMMIILSILGATPDYLYLEQCGLQWDLSETKAEYNCVMIGYDHGQGFPEALKLSEFQNVLVVGYQEMEMIEPSEMGCTKLVIYVWDGLETEQILAQTADRLLITNDFREVQSDITNFRAYVAVNK